MRCYLVAGLLLLGACERKRGAGDAGANAFTAPEGPPTAEECGKAVARMKELDPEEVAGDQADRDTCAKLPRQVVRCLIDARSQAEADGCVHGYAAAPERRASEDECRKAMAHARGVLARAGLRDGGSDESLMAQCARSATRADIECLTAARTVIEVKQCGYDETR